MSREYNPIVQLQQKGTYKAAVKAKCAECMGCTAEEMEPGFREAISNCSAYTCPLLAYRPYQKKGE